MASNVPLETMLAQASKHKKKRKKKKEKPAEEGSGWGKRGGDLRAAKLTPERKKEIARIAAQARWAKKKDEGPEQPPPES